MGPLFLTPDHLQGLHYRHPALLPDPCPHLFLPIHHASLSKKANKLSIPCGIEIDIIIFFTLLPIQARKNREDKLLAVALTSTTAMPPQPTRPPSSITHANSIPLGPHPHPPPPSLPLTRPFGKTSNAPSRGAAPPTSPPPPVSSSSHLHPPTPPLPSAIAWIAALSTSSMAAPPPQLLTAALYRPLLCSHPSSSSLPPPSMMRPPPQPPPPSSYEPDVSAPIPPESPSPHLPVR